LDNQAANLFFGGALAVTGLTATMVGGWAATRWQRATGFGYEWALALSALAAAPMAFVAFHPGRSRVGEGRFGGFDVPDFSVNRTGQHPDPRIGAGGDAGYGDGGFDFCNPHVRRCVVAAGGRLFSDTWNDLQRAVLWVLPVSLAVCALIWCSLVVQSKRAPATGPT
jgi:hypothetical protein